ncbi:dienelactone hydrolase family protein [Amycolatopsis sp. NPDC049253]|uniref:dienelactone hydrolase family protein n=1 Tax=Amycolatopsis sp. NPDC049253 TaxID=3155274 RepID=UPI00342B4B18
MPTRVDRLQLADGPVDLPVWLPAGGRGPGLVLVQEIFGLDAYLSGVASDLADLGYVVAVPELFHRFAPGWSSAHDEAGVARSMEVSGQLDPALALSDVLATLAHLRAMTSGAGVLGFCLGGSLAFAAAAAGTPDTAVSFYGSTVAAEIASLDEVVVSAGLGVALLPRLLVLDAPPSVVVLPMRQPTIVRRLCTCRLGTRGVTAPSRQLEAYLREAATEL